MYGKLRRLSHFLIKKVLLSFEVSLPPHRVDGHRHRRHEPKPSSNVLNVSGHLSEVRIDQIFSVFYHIFKAQILNCHYLGYC
jgi:hypothetical protein